MVYNAGNNVSGRVRPRTRAVPGPPSGMEWSAFAKRNKKRNIFESSSIHRIRRPLGRLILWVKMDSNHRSRETADLQSAPFGHSGIHPA